MRQPDTMGNIDDVRTVHARLLERWNAGELNRGHAYAIQKVLEQAIGSKELLEIVEFFMYEKQPKRAILGENVRQKTGIRNPETIYEIFMTKWQNRGLNQAHVFAIARILETKIGSPELLAILRAFKPKTHEPGKSSGATGETTDATARYVSNWQAEEAFFNSQPPEYMEPGNMPFWEISGHVKPAIAAILAALAIGGIGLEMCEESDGNDTPGIETKDPKPDTGNAAPDGTTGSTTINPDNLFAQSEMPSTTEAMGLFFLDKFRNGKLKRANERMRRRNDPFAQSYRRLEEEANITPLMRKRWHEIFARYTETFGKEVDLDAKASIWGGDDMRIPRERELRKGHNDALDIFFTRIRKRGEAEIGPEIHAYSGGLVIAARGDWQGGQGEKKYQQGGLSPKAGNGVIIYNPRKEKYYYYAHMDRLTVSPGDIIPAGQVIGYGGNTGAIARKPGRGGHVHFEIHEVDQGGRNMANTPFVLKSQIDSNEILG